MQTKTFKFLTSPTGVYYSSLSIKCKDELRKIEKCHTADYVIMFKKKYKSIQKSELSLLVISKFGVIVFSISILKSCHGVSLFSLVTMSHYFLLSRCLINYEIQNILNIY